MGQNPTLIPRLNQARFWMPRFSPSLPPSLPAESVLTVLVLIREILDAQIGRGDEVIPEAGPCCGIIQRLVYCLHQNLRSFRSLVFRVFHVVCCVLCVVCCVLCVVCCVLCVVYLVLVSGVSSFACSALILSPSDCAKVFEQTINTVGRDTLSIISTNTVPTFRTLSSGFRV